METVFDAINDFDVDQFVRGIRKEITGGSGCTMELTQNFWYVYSPVGVGKTPEGMTRAYYGERATCTRCEVFSWDLSYRAASPNFSCICHDCLCALRSDDARVA